MIDLTTPEDAERLIAESDDEPFLLFKHSTRCPVSAHAANEIAALANGGEQPLRVARVLVVEHRPVSLWLAERLAVRHASPQAILVKDGRAVWQTSHYGISRAAVADAVKVHVGEKAS